MSWRAVVERLVSRTQGGEVELVHPDGTRTRHGVQDGRSSLHATVTIHDDGVYRQWLRGSLGLAETYMDGRWDADDVTALIRIAARNARSFDRLRGTLAPVLWPAQRLSRRLRRNTVAGSRHNISAHYDLGNELFALFLDPTMMYSCAVFERPGMSLEEASIAKLDRVCRKLDLQPGDRLLEIGTGWGALAIHAARQYGAHVTTTTISREQHALATRRVREAGLEGQVEVLLEDYRSLRGRYDKLVSIEMIEAVGWQYFPTYFQRCAGLLADDGLMLIQAITIDDRAYEAEKAARSFINTYVFPSGCLPSMEVIQRCVARHTDLRTVGVEDISPHYVETLRRWREQFVAATDELERLGYDERFRRMWELYLRYSEAGFAERRIQDVQVVFAKPHCRVEPRLAVHHEPLAAAG